MAAAVAPPRGVRGLKFVLRKSVDNRVNVAPPRGVRGLKCRNQYLGNIGRVAPPRGVRGLKLLPGYRWKPLPGSHPLVGCVD